MSPCTSTFNVVDMDVVLRKGAERLEVEASIVTTEVLRRTFLVIKNLEFLVYRARASHAGYTLSWLARLVIIMFAVTTA